MKQPTLLVLSQVYPPDTPAVGQYMHDAAREFVQRGFQVRVLASARGYENPTERYPRQEVCEGVRIRRLPLSSFGKSSILIRLIGGISFTLQCILHGLFVRGLTHVLVSTSPPMCPLAAVVLSWFRRIQITYWVMDLNPDQMIELGKARPTDLQVRIFEWLNRQILRRARAVVALDRFMAERLNRKMDISSKLVVLPPWPLEDHVEPISHEENPFRRQHGLEGKIVIMYSGNLSLASPVDTLLEAAGRVTDLENLLFLFVGGGLLKQQVDELIATGGGTNLRTLPYQPLEDLRYSLSAADVHLVAIGEKIVGICHPCKIYGAMAAARPILSLGPAACHAGDILADRNIGWSVAHGDVQRMEAVIRKIHGLSTEHRKEMGDEARRMINEQFSKERICGQFLAIVEHGPRGDAARREQESSQLPVLSRG